MSVKLVNLDELEVNPVFPVSHTNIKTGNIVAINTEYNNRVFLISDVLDYRHMVIGIAFNDAEWGEPVKIAGRFNTLGKPDLFYVVSED
jgi:hypothetical protein